MSSHPEKIVYFVRHGESRDNAAPVFQAPDSPLSEKGQRQAALIAQRASSLVFDTLIASPLARTAQTAEAIAQATGKEIEYSELFVERVKPTSTNGKPYTDAKASALYHDWQKSLHTSGLRTEDGENFDDLIVRADRALGFLRDRTETMLLVVTHGYFLRTLVARVLLGDLLTPETFRSIHKTAATENTGLTALRYLNRNGTNPSWQLWIYNDHAHLAE